MKKINLSLLSLIISLLALCFILYERQSVKKDYTEIAENSGAVWSTYGELTAGNIGADFDFLIRDTNDTAMALTGTQKRYKWSSMLADMIASHLDADESSDATLTELGQVHIRGDEDSISFHMGAGGEVAGEVSVSVIKTAAASVDPGSWYDSDHEMFLFKVRSDVYPNGIIIDEWEVSCNVDPDVEIDADLRYADDWIGLANPVDIDEIDTTNGTSSEDTDANINGGSAIPVNKVIYIGFDDDPEGTCTQMHFEMEFHGEED